ncbi:MAG: hypothetical protein IJ150_05890 [Bacteroidales bacterium]|nr:hypothetical protein [Bacteroidales bacterium]
MAVQKLKKIKHTEAENLQFIRKHRQSFMLNDLELQALTKYFKKYKIKNRAKFLRETIMGTIIKKFEEDYPRLFEVPEKQQEEKNPQLKIKL